MHTKIDTSQDLGIIVSSKCHRKVRKLMIGLAALRLEVCKKIGSPIVTY